MKRFLTLVLLSGMLFSLHAQRNSERSLFEQGLSQYKQGNFPVAENIFLQLVQDYPEGQLITATRLMLAKSYYKLGSYAKAEPLCKFFIRKHPNSGYLDDVRHLLGSIYFRKKDYSGAADEWLWVVGNTRDPRLKEQAGNYAYNTLVVFLNQQEISRLSARHASRDSRGILDIASAALVIKTGNGSRAQSMLKRFLSEQPNHFYASEANRLLGGSDGGSSAGGSRSGGFVFLKPAEGDTKEISDELQKGMEYAVFEHSQKNPGSAPNLVPVEIDETVISAISSAASAIRQSNPAAVIGPIDSDQSAGLSLLSRYEKRPYIIPLSSQSGLTDLSQFAFQVNPDVRTKGRFLGQYAMNEFEAKNFAILAPANDYGKGYAESFRSAIESRGGQVIAEQWYYENTADFSRQFRAIRRQGLFQSFSDSLAEAEPGLDDDEVQRQFRSYLDVKFKPLRPGARVDSTDLAVHGVDALLIVIRSSQFIEYLAPQFAFHNIQTRLLGNEGWNDSEQLRKYRTHIDGITFVSQGYLDPNSWNFKEFLNRFRSKMGITPGEYHLLGYDIMKWILSNHRDGQSADGLRKNLENSRRYEGIMKNIQFNLDTPRVNSDLTVLRLNLGQIIKLN